MLKNASLILNGLLLLLVGNLYWKVYKTPAAPTVAVATSAGDSTQTAVVAPVSGIFPASKVAYVNSDSILDHLTSFKNEKAELERIYKERGTALQNRTQQFQAAYMALDEKAKKGTVPPAQLQAEAQQLQQQEQEIGQQQAKAEKELQEKIQKLNENLQRRVIGQLEKMKAARGFDYVLSYSKAGSPVLITNGAYDLTAEVLTALNQK